MRKATTTAEPTAEPIVDRAELPWVDHTAEEPEEKEPEKKGLGLSAPGLVGGALASMTSAVVGSQLGVAGTIGGAALSSAVVAVAGAVYTKTLNQGHKKVTTALKRNLKHDEVDANAETRALPVTGAQPTVSLDTVPADTLDTVTNVAPATGTADPTDETHVLPIADNLPESNEPVRKRRPKLKTVLVGAAATFVIAIVGVTGYENISGNALSGGTGSTVSQIVASNGSVLNPNSEYSQHKQAEARQAETGNGRDSQDQQPAADPTGQAPQGQATQEQRTDPTAAPSGRATNQAEPTTGATGSNPTQSSTTGTNSGSGSGSGSDSGSGTGSNSGTGSDTGSNSGTNSGSGTNSNSGSGSGSGSGTGSNSGTGTGSGANSGTGSNWSTGSGSTGSGSTSTGSGSSAAE